jgi:phosphoribosylformylglycinamidine synthase
MDVKNAGNFIFIVGETKNELGGSHYYKLYQQLGANVPTLDLKKGPKIAERLSKAISEGLVASCHDCSEGGLAVALAEMAFAGGLGIEANLKALPKTVDCVRTDAQLFSESNSRFVVEIEPDKFDDFAKLMLNLPFGQIGMVIEQPMLTIKDAQDRPVVNAELETLKQSWQKTFDW